MDESSLWSWLELFSEGLHKIWLWLVDGWCVICVLSYFLSAGHDLLWHRGLKPLTLMRFMSLSLQFCPVWLRVPGCSIARCAYTPGGYISGSQAPLSFLNVPLSDDFPCSVWDWYSSPAFSLLMNASMYIFLHHFTSVCKTGGSVNSYNWASVLDPLYLSLLFLTIGI